MMYRIFYKKGENKLFVMPGGNGFSKSSFASWEKGKAENMLRQLNSQKKHRDKKFLMEEVPGASEKPVKTPESPKQEMEAILDNIVEFKKTEDIKKAAILDKIKNEEAAVMDIIHYIEFDDNPHLKAEEYVREIKAHRMKRREYKDTLFLMETMHGIIRHDTSTVIKAVENQRKGLNERKYLPRYKEL